MAPTVRIEVGTGEVIRPAEASDGVKIVLHKPESVGCPPILDDIDRHILQLLQRDASLSVREIGERVGLSATPCWRRIRNLEDSGVITRRVAVIEPAAVNLAVTALVLIRTNEHNRAWVADFVAGIDRFEEVVEAYRTSGEIDYLLKVRVPDIAAYDAFYQRLIEEVDLYDVRTTFVMEEIKSTTEIPLRYA